MIFFMMILLKDKGARQQRDAHRVTSVDSIRLLEVNTYSIVLLIIMIHLIKMVVTVHKLEGFGRPK